MERQQIIKQLYENSKLSYDNMNDREICNLLIEQNKYIEELYEIYNYELAKYNSKFEEDSFDAMAELNKVFEPYLKRKKSGCFFPDRS